MNFKGGGVIVSKLTNHKRASSSLRFRPLIAKSQDDSRELNSTLRAGVKSESAYAFQHSPSRVLSDWRRWLLWALAA